MGSSILLGAVIFLAASVIKGMICKKNTFVRLICIGASAAVAFFGTLIFKSSLDDPSSVLEYAEGFLGYETISGIKDVVAQSSVLGEVISKICASLTAPLIFLVLFWALYFVTGIIRIVFGIIGMILRKKKKPKLLTRALIGLAYGLIMLTCMLVPVSTYLGIADSLLVPIMSNDLGTSTDATAEAAAPVSDAMGTEDILSAVAEANDSFVIKAHRACGGQLISNAFTNIKLDINDQRHNLKLNDELSSIVDFVFDLTELMAPGENGYTKEQIDTINNLGTSLMKSKLLAVTAADLVRGVADSWGKGEPFLGVEKPAFGEQFDPLINKTLEIMGNDSSNLTYLEEDINTFARITAIVLESSSESNGESGANALLAEGMVTDLLKVVTDNPRMRPLIPVVTNIGLKMVSETLGIPENSTEAYNKLIENVTSQLQTNINAPEEQRLDAMKTTISSSLSSLGVTGVDDSEITIMAVAIISNFDSSSDITADAVSAFFTNMTSSVSSGNGNVSYSMVGVAYVNGNAAGKLIADICDVRANSSLSPAQKESQISSLIANSQLFINSNLSTTTLIAAQSDILSAVDSTKSPSVSKNSVAGLNPQNAKDTFIFTLENILVDEDALSDPNMPQDKVEALNNTVTLVFESAISVATNMGNMNSADGLNEMYNGLGQMFDALASNEDLYGKEKTSILIKTVLNSDSISANTGFAGDAIETLLDEQAKLDVSYTALFNTVGKTANILSSIQNGEAMTDQTFIDLVDALAAEKSGEVIASLFTKEKLSEMGFKDDGSGKIDTAAGLLKNVFTSIAAVTDPAAHEKEAAAVKHILNVALDAKNNTDASGNAFNSSTESAGRLSCTAPEMIDMILESNAVCSALTTTELSDNPFGIKLSDADISLLLSAITAKKATSDKDVALDNIARLFGIAL